MAERFLISRLSALGDVVCCLPAAGALKAAFPESEIHWVVDPRFSGVVKCCRHVDSVIEAKPGFKRDSWPMPDGEFDAALDLQGLLKSAMAIKGARAKTKVGYHWQREGAWLFSERVIPDDSSIHVVDQYVDVARAVGGIADGANFGLVPKPDDLERIAQKLPAGQYAVVNGGAGWATKRWPPEQFGALVDGLDAIGVHTVLIGGRGEEDLSVGSAIEEAARTKPINLIGQTSIMELVALLSRAQVHVGGDTGSTHMAAALGIPAVGLYSITRPARSCPYGQIDRCCYDPRGLRHIPASKVLAAVRESLAQ